MFMDDEGRSTRLRTVQAGRGCREPAMKISVCQEAEHEQGREDGGPASGRCHPRSQAS